MKERANYSAVQNFSHGSSQRELEEHCESKTFLITEKVWQCERIGVTETRSHLDRHRRIQSTGMFDR
jgi:hypothetical protein